MNALTPVAPLDLSPLDFADIAPSTRTKYKAALLALHAAHVHPLDIEAMRTYAATLSPSGKAFLKAALKIMFHEYVRRIKAGANEQNIHKVQAALLNLEAMDDTLTVYQPEPERLPHWLSQSQVDELTARAFRTSLRDYIVIALLVGCGLRREELANLRFSDLQQIDGQTVLYFRGKGDKPATVPVPAILLRHLSEWKSITGDGYVARAMDKYRNIRDSLSAVGIFAIVRKYGALIGIPDLDPHDLRRTWARLVYEQTHNLLLVQDLLRHSDARTTKKYIGVQHLTEAPNVLKDFSLQITGD